eukprot:780408-Alexandrium_andersonii.AAC.1
MQGKAGGRPCLGPSPPPRSRQRARPLARTPIRQGGRPPLRRAAGARQRPQWTQRCALRAAPRPTPRR